MDAHLAVRDLSVWPRRRAALVGAVGLILLGYWFTPDPIPGYSGILTPKIETLLSPTSGTRRILELGKSGAKFELADPKLTTVIDFFHSSRLTLEEIGGRLMVSTQIRDPHGELVAELIRNEWRVAPPPKTWDRNYDNDRLEVKNAKGQIVLQVRAFPDRIQILGEWWGQNGMGARIIRPPGQWAVGSDFAQSLLGSLISAAPPVEIAADKVHDKRGCVPDQCTIMRRRARQHVIDHDGGDGGDETKRGRKQRLGDARRNDRQICWCAPARCR